MDSESLRYRGAAQRRSYILERLHKSGYLTISDLARDMGVSEMTVRRDARRLDAVGDAISIRGGLRLPSPQADETGTEYLRREHAEADAKHRIGVAAAAEINDGDVIAIDAGTTAYQVAEALPQGFSGTIVTHSVPVINYLLGRNAAKTIALGGDLYEPSRALVGSMTVDNARRLRVRAFFLGAAAVDERGVYASADVERHVKETLMDICDQVILLVDHSKFNTTAPVFLCEWSKVNLLISDEQPAAVVSEYLLRNAVTFKSAG